jgi:hypothetical protein
VRVSQFFFTKVLAKPIESVYTPKNPQVYVKNQLNLYFYWWGYQNKVNKRSHITHNVAFVNKKLVYLYQL